MAWHAVPRCAVMRHLCVATSVDVETCVLWLAVALHQSIGWQLTPSNRSSKGKKRHPKEFPHKQTTCDVMSVLYNLAAELHLTMAASKKVKLSRGAHLDLTSAHKKRQERIQHLRTQLGIDSILVD